MQISHAVDFDKTKNYCPEHYSYLKPIMHVFEILRCAGMAEYPPDWQIFDAEEYATFHRSPPVHNGGGIHMLVPVNAAGRSTGSFRINVFGAGSFSVRFKLSKIMNDLPPWLDSIEAELVSTLEDITPPPNMTATPWDDVEDKYKKRNLLLSMPNGEAFPESEFLAYLRSPTSDKSCLGASLRWAIAGAPTANAIQLELQSLPTQARYLTKPNLRADNSISVLVQAFTLNADFFDGHSHAGPVPLLFSPDLTATAAALAANEYVLYEDLIIINNNILQMEHMTKQEAVTYLQKPKARKATGTPAFSSASSSSSRPSQPPQKKGRYNQFPALETGKFFLTSSALFIYKSSSL